jgi:hypothetical protein
VASTVAGREKSKEWIFDAFGAVQVEPLQRLLWNSNSLNSEASKIDENDKKKAKEAEEKTKTRSSWDYGKLMNYKFISHLCLSLPCFRVVFSAKNPAQDSAATKTSNARLQPILRLSSGTAKTSRLHTR